MSNNVGNYFSKPKGLNPTPAVCFPPPPPTPKGLITGELIIAQEPGSGGQTYRITFVSTNNAYGPDTNFGTNWNTPHLTGEAPTYVQNGQPISFLRSWDGVPGTWVGSVICHWPNGQVRTFTYPYETGN